LLEVISDSGRRLAHEGNEVVQESQFGDFTVPMESITIFIPLVPSSIDTILRFTLFDSGGDGINLDVGFFLLSWSNPEFQFVLLEPESFRYEISTDFVLKPDGSIALLDAPTASPTQSSAPSIQPTPSPTRTTDVEPSEGPYLELDILFDLHPADVFWTLTETETETELYATPPGVYSTYSQGNTASSYLIISLDTTYAFTIFDKYEDGLCCMYGEGAYTLTFVDENNDVTNIKIGNEYGVSETTVFRITADGQVEVATPPPTSAPTDALAYRIAEDEILQPPPEEGDIKSAVFEDEKKGNLLEMPRETEFAEVGTSSVSLLGGSRQLVRSFAFSAVLSVALYLM